LLGEIAGDAMLMNGYGLAAALTLEWLAQRYTYVDLDEWIVMPNHVHAIILIDGHNVGAVREPPVPGRETKIKPLGSLVGAFKTVSSKKINQMRGTPGAMVATQLLRARHPHREGTGAHSRLHLSQCAGLVVRSRKPARIMRRLRARHGRFTNRPYRGPAYKTSAVEAGS
jgi:hypothetical protein